MRLLRRLAHWRRLSARQADLVDEMAHHRDMIERDLIARGMSPADAQVEARRMMGNLTLMREEARAVWLWPSLEAIWQDARYTLRDLRRNPIFTAGVTLTLALGIGANGAMFSLVDRLLFRPPARMVEPAMVNRVYLYRTADGRERETGGIYARYIDLARFTTSFSHTSGFALRKLATGVGNETRLRNVAVVSADFFGFFDAPPVIGRYFTASEDAPPTPAPVAVLSHRMWETEFGSRTDVLGLRLQIDAVTYTIIGVAPDGFVGLWPYQPPAVFVPVATYAASRGHPDWATSYGTAFGLGIIVRRKPNVSIAAASADLTNALRRSYQVQGATPLDVLRPRAIAASILAERGPQPSNVTRAATWLSGVTVLVLLIACANVANLLLARTISHRREIAVRVALGVSRARLFGQLLTEGVILALLGGGAGLVIAMWGGGVLAALFLPGAERVPVLTDSRTLVFIGAMALGIGMLVGLAPLMQVGRTDLTADLKTGAREGTYQRRRLRSALVLIQCALSTLLLVGTGLFVQSLQKVRHVRLGFDPDSVLVVSLNMRDVKLDSAAMAGLRLRLLESAKGVPGVTFASLRESVPFAGMSSWPIFVSGIDSTAALGEFDFNAVSADYFKTMGTRIVRGRAIEPTDINGARPVLVVGESMAKVLWPGEDPIGKCVRVGLVETAQCRYVVGVAEDIHSQSIDVEPKLYFYYMPAAQWQPQEGGLFLRTRGNPARIAEQVRQRLQQEMPGTSFITTTPLGDIVDATLRSWIVGTTLFTSFGALALVLAAIGLYSVIAYNVVQRQHELGVRVALGASRTGVVHLVVLDGIRVALAGLLIGMIVAALAGRWIGPLLFRQSPHDPVVFAVVAVVLFGVAVVASGVPAVRAARVDPKTALLAD
ncbi:MAG TPA: ADOP family duplicated permease [Gemmatimonadaceae bacterium]|nr:ADOP family duplicated permease [Gemmatimonadaceae bacterium]